MFQPDRFVFHMQFFRHAGEMEYARNWRRLIARSKDLQRLGGFDFVSFKRPYERLYLVYDAGD